MPPQQRTPAADNSIRSQFRLAVAKCLAARQHPAAYRENPDKIGRRLTPGRVWKNMGMPGHMGDERITIQNLEIVQVREADGVILVSGAIPGAKGTFVMVRPSIKKSGKSTKAAE